MVLYHRAPRRGRLGDEAAVFIGHGAFLYEQRRRGRNPISGPFGDRGKLRGVSIYDSIAVEDVGRWLSDDPTVVQGWMSVVARPWWGVAGSIPPGSDASPRSGARTHYGPTVTNTGDPICLRFTQDSRKDIMRSNGIFATPRTLAASIALVAGGVFTLVGGVGAAAALASSPTCHDTQLSFSLVSGGAGLGHVALLFEIRNVSGRTCTLSGYPKVALRSTAKTKWISAADTKNGYLGGLGHTHKHKTSPVVVLRAHTGTASAMIEGSSVPVGSATRCSNFHTVNLRLPNDSTVAGFYFTFPACVTPQVHPIVAGTYGSAG